MPSGIPPAPQSSGGFPSSVTVFSSTATKAVIVSSAEIQAELGDLVAQIVAHPSALYAVKSCA